MGWFGIPIKPSTALIYELAFGIAIDNSIHFLSVYRWQRLNYGLKVTEAISTTIRTTGTSILYTSIVLLSGFLIFVFSAFGSTQALGILTSVTLLIALFSNLLLMPVLLRIM
jgi:predicted RND superfamily exporter protein